MARENEGSVSTTHRTHVERKSDLELVVTRTFDAPVHIVFDAWSKPELFRSWWIPKSAPITLESCEMDIRTGGKYRLVFSHPDFPQTMAFFGTYTEVTPNTRLVWTNEESEQGAITTVTFQEKDGRTQVVYSERYPTKEALDEAMTGSAEGLPEQFAQLDEMLAAA